MNYIVSNLQEIWDENAEDVLIADPYILYNNKESGIFSKYNTAISTDHIIKTKLDLYAADKKTNSYRTKFIDLLAPVLNDIHGKNHDNKFWEIVLSVGMDRYITLCYDFFEKTKQGYDPSFHTSYILQLKDFTYPNNFDDQRDFLQHDDLGQEQLLSIYIRLFHPENILEKKLTLTVTSPKSINQSILSLILERIKNIYRYPLKFFKYLFLLHTLFQKKRVLLQRVLFSDRNLIKLITKSFGKISVDLKPINFSASRKTESIDETKRERLSNIAKTIDSADQFELFFFETVSSLFPKLFLEDFQEIYKNTNEWALSYRNLKYVVSETWPSDSIDALKIAVLKNLYDTVFIYNEHNYIEHCYLGSLVHKSAEIADKFISLGWHDRGIKNLEIGGSLFDFKPSSYNFSTKKNHKICFVAGALLARAPQHSSSYSFCGYGALQSIRFTEIFLSNLSQEIINNIYFRAYPLERLNGVAKYDYEDVLKDRFNFCYFDTSNNDSKKIMLDSELVIINYLSTSHLETLSMNIPTIVIFDADSYHLNKSHLHFFDGLIEAGVIQNSPHEASQFLDSIYSSINDWWLGEGVQKARTAFINSNFGNPNVLESKMLKLAQSSVNK
jgi:putative transferase (TIGR04331 family)